MKKRRRYALFIVLLLMVFFVYFYLLTYQFNNENEHLVNLELAPAERRSSPLADSHLYSNWADSYLTPIDILQEKASEMAPRHESTAFHSDDEDYSCTMESCFDTEQCRRHGFRVYVYPQEEVSTEIYTNILTALRSSVYSTTNAEEACLFVPALDTIDRDHLSPNFGVRVASQLTQLPYWKNGRNHLIFNMYAGTWPHYFDHEFHMAVGQAILAKASFAINRLRQGFDISFPLIHRQHSAVPGSATAGHETALHGYAELYRAHRPYLLAFKGKRYVYGKGSDTRNALYHLHNAADIIMLTTCKHGTNWQQFSDKNCDKDNMEYDKFDYNNLLQNSTFCLVPRGRRLGSYRFLEALEFGCIPVLLSNDLVLPFHEVLDWSRAVIWADERLLFQVPSILRAISVTRILELRQHGRWLWKTYLSSVQIIIRTTLEVLRERVEPWNARPSFMWNSIPGALATDIRFSKQPCALPWKYLGRAASHSCSVNRRFSAIFLMRQPCTLSRFISQVEELGRSRGLRDLLVHWQCLGPAPRRTVFERHLPVQVRLKIILANDKTSPNSFFSHWDWLDTDVVLTLYSDVFLSREHINYAFSVWRNFPDHLVGFERRSHYWDDFEEKWEYSSAPAPTYSMVLTSAAFSHRYFHYLYWQALSERLRNVVDIFGGCEDLLMNFLISHVTRNPPIALLSADALSSSSASSSHMESRLGAAAAAAANKLMQRSVCLQAFSRALGYMPLIRSHLRFDPVLYLDPVARWRKLYPAVEQAVQN